MSCAVCQGRSLSSAAHARHECWERAWMLGRCGEGTDCWTAILYELICTTNCWLIELIELMSLPIRANRKKPDSNEQEANDTANLKLCCKPTQKERKESRTVFKFVKRNLCWQLPNLIFCYFSPPISCGLQGVFYEQLYLSLNKLRTVYWPDFEGTPSCHFVVRGWVIVWMKRSFLFRNLRVCAPL